MSINAEDVKELNRIIRKVDRLSGPGVINTREQIVIGLPSRLPAPTRRSSPSEFTVVKINSTTFPATLGIGWYWGVVQERNATAFDPTANLDLHDYYDDPDDPGTVLVYNDVESAALIRTVPYSAAPLLIAWDTGETADVVPAAGGDAVTYNVYGTKGLVVAC